MLFKIFLIFKLYVFETSHFLAPLLPNVRGHLFFLQNSTVNLLFFYKINDRIGLTHVTIEYKHDRTRFTHDTIGFIYDRIGQTFRLINEKALKRSSRLT